jgi:ferredoxin
MANNLASIDYSKCIDCGVCAAVCPTNAILDTLKGTRRKSEIDAGSVTDVIFVYRIELALSKVKKSES